MSGVSKPTLSLGGPVWARRTLAGIGWCLIAVLGITTLNGTAASGFTHVPNAFKQIFGFLSQKPKPPKGYMAATPAQLSQDIQSQRDQFLGQKVAVYGRVLPWTDEELTKTSSKEGELGLKGLKPRPGTFMIALYADPTEHPDMYARPITINVRASEEWKSAHTAVQDQWVQVWGREVVYAPSAGQGQPEIQMDDFEVIQEPFDIYDHNLPVPKPGAED